MIIKQFASVLFALMLLCTTASAASKMGPQTRLTLRDAQLLLDAKKYAEAASLLENYFAKSDEPHTEQSYLMLGGAHHLSGQKAKAAQDFSKGCTAFPHNEQLALNAAIAYYEINQYTQAGHSFEKVYMIQKTPNPLHLFQAGSAFYAGANYKNSARVMLKLLANHKKQKQDWIKLAVHALLGAKQYLKAEQMILKYLSVNPTEASYWELLAKLYLDKDAYRQAAGALEITYRLRQPTEKELERLASVYNYIEAPLLAAATLKRAYSHPTNAQSEKIALLSASAGRINEAIKRLSNGNENMLQQKGIILFTARRFDEAVATFKKVLQRNSQLMESRYHLALCAWEKRQWDTARTELNKLAGSKKYRIRAAVPLAVLDDIVMAREEARQ